MNNLSQECIEQINVVNTYSMLTSQRIFMDGAKSALTNPTLYQSAGLIDIQKMDKFIKWAAMNAYLRITGNWWYEKNIITTTELLEIFNLQNQT